MKGETTFTMIHGAQIQERIILNYALLTNCIDIMCIIIIKCYRVILALITLHKNEGEQWREREGRIRKRSGGRGERWKNERKSSEGREEGLGQGGEIH